MIGLTCSALAVVFWLRRPEMFHHPQFWAEDATIFFLQADSEGAAALLRPYGGYHHLLLRLIAAAIAPLDAALVPAGYFYASLAVTLGLAAALFSPRIDLSFRPACALAIGLVPHSGEVIGNLTNLQWPAALGLIWLLLVRDAVGVRQRITDALLALVLGLTGVFSILFAPLFVYRAAQRRSSAGWWLAVVVCLAAAVQLHALWPRESSPAQPWPLMSEVLKTVGLRLGGALFLPAEWAQRMPPVACATLGVACLAALAIAASWPGPRRNERVMLASCATLMVAATLFRLRNDLGQLAGIAMGDRYFYLPKLLSVWLLIQACAAGDWRRRLAIVAGACVLATSLTGWRYERLEDQHWPDYARRIERGEKTVDIPINPGWKFTHPGRAGAPPWRR